MYVFSMYQQKLYFGSWLPLQGYIDVGGGLGIDYNGTKSASPASTNYSMQVIMGQHENLYFSLTSDTAWTFY